MKEASYLARPPGGADRYCRIGSVGIAAPTSRTIIKLPSDSPVGKDKIVRSSWSTRRPENRCLRPHRARHGADGMPEMATKNRAGAGGEPGSYRFKAAFGMEGRCASSAPRYKARPARRRQAVSRAK